MASQWLKWELLDRSMWEECLRHVICSNVQLCPISYLKVIFLCGSAELHPSNHSQLHPAAPRGYNNGWIHKGQIRVNWCCYCCSTPAPVEHLAAKQADSFLRRRWRPNKSSKTNDDWTVMNRNVALLPNECWNIYHYWCCVSATKTCFWCQWCWKGHPR